jgi:hypothetical protein
MTLVSFDDDLDWEFAFDSRLELPTFGKKALGRAKGRVASIRPTTSRLVA